MLAVAIPYLPFADVFGFVPISAATMAAILAVTGIYVVVAEIVKAWFYRRAA